MIPTPFQQKRRLFLRFFTFLLFSSFVCAAIQAADQPKRIEISIPERIVAGQEITVEFALLDQNKKIVRTDKRSLEVQIFNNEKKEIRTLVLNKGSASEKITFSDAGASMIQAWDPAHKNLVGYASFDVQYAPKRKIQ